MRLPIITIKFSATCLAIGIANNLNPRYSVLQVGEEVPHLLRRSPMGDAPSSRRGPSPDPPLLRTSSQNRLPITRDQTPSGNTRRPVAVGEIGITHPATGYMSSGIHGKWGTNPLPGASSSAKMKHPEVVCVGGKCSHPENGVVMTDVVGKHVATTVDTRRGGTVKIAKNADMTADPEWATFPPGHNFVHTVSAKPNTLARQHVQLTGGGSVDAAASMPSFERTDPEVNRPGRI